MTLKCCHESFFGRMIVNKMKRLLDQYISIHYDNIFEIFKAVHLNEH